MVEVLTEVRPDGVATLTLAAPDRRNALTTAMANELLAACDELDADPRVGAVVVQAQGSTFCAGGHRALLAAAAKDPAEDEAFANLTRIYESFARVGRLEAPTIAAVRGAAVGAGLNLALATDLRIVADDARLFSGFLPLKAHPGGGHFALLNRTAGRETAAAVGLFGLDLTGQEAVTAGLAWAAVPAGQVESRCLELAASVAASPLLARRAARSFRLEVGPPALAWETAIQFEQPNQMWSFRNGPMGQSPS